MVFENWVDVLVNGELIQRFMVPQGRSEFCLFRGMDRSKVRRVQIVRDTQAMHLDARNFFTVCLIILRVPRLIEIRFFRVYIIRRPAVF